jgi:hypothetical protein
MALPPFLGCTDVVVVVFADGVVDVVDGLVSTMTVILSFTK